MNCYKVLNNNVFRNKNFTLVPIRFEDRYEVMKWRNEQIHHLRQRELLTKEQQDFYFIDVVDKLFEQEFPCQILFSFLKNEELMGYGGLVHIDWSNKNAEVSFLSKYSDDLMLWKPFLELLKIVAFNELDFVKIYTYAYDIRPNLYPILEESEFILEGRLSNSVLKQNKLLDIVIHSCFNNKRDFFCRSAVLSDAALLFHWTNDPIIRAMSLNPDFISWREHLDWYYNKILSNNTKIYLYYSNGNLIGNLRLDQCSQGYQLSYLVDSNYRGLGYGKRIISDAIERCPSHLIATVKLENLKSNKIFEGLGFTLVMADYNVNTWIYIK